MKLAALLVAAGAATSPAPDAVPVVEMEQGEAVQMVCTAEAGCVAMSKALFDALLKRAAEAGAAQKCWRPA